MDETEFCRWVEKSRASETSDEDIAKLAESLAASGERLEVRERSADLSSTGGPGSLSTLWAPAILAASGYTVPKLGVPGRPAGGVDALAQVPGYRVDLNRIEAKAALDDCGYVHLLAGNHFAPADAAMFAYRQRTGAQGIAALAIASLLAKKLAMGIQLVGLEVRVSRYGNFGRDVATARQNAHRFCGVAQRLGLDSLCIVTDGNRPQQPYIGRGEAILAIARLLHNEDCPWLSEHASSCGEWVSALIDAPAATRSDTARSFSANLICQGGTTDGLLAKASVIAAAHTKTVEASRDGILQYDGCVLRDAILAARMPDKGTSFDDSAGLILLVRPGSFVKAGEPVVSVRCCDKHWPAMRRAVTNAIELASGKQDNTSITFNGAMEIIGVRNR